MQSGTIGNRLLVHLSCYSRYREEFVCPPEMTQDGMARKLGISRAHAALELKRLKQRNHVESRLAHVARAKTRRKVYSLTMAGEEQARKLKEDAKSKLVRVIDGNGGVECTGQDALRLLCSRGLSESEAYSLMLTSDTVSLRAREEGNVADANRGLLLVGRDQEVSRLSRWFNSPGKALCVLSSSEGMGKTTLALSLFSNINGPLIWTTVRPRQSVRSVLSAVGNKLAGLGKTRLSLLMDADAFDEREVAIALAEDVAEGLLVFDDVHNSPEFEDFAGMFITMNNWPLKVLLVGRRKPGFCHRWSDTFQKPYEDISIGGLDLESTRRLIESSGRACADEELVNLHEATFGRPQDILVIIRSGWRGGREIPSIKDALSAAMNLEQKTFVGLAAVLHGPIDPTRVDLSTGETSLLNQRWLFSRNDDGFMLNGLVRETVLETLESHELPELHQRAATVQSSMGNHLEAVNHFFQADQQSKAIEMMAVMRNSLPWRDAGHSLLEHLRSVADTSALEAVRGQVLQGLGRLDEARLSFEKAVAFESGPTLVDVLLRLSNLEVQLLSPHDAELHASKALEIADRTGDRVMCAKAMSSVAYVCNLRGRAAEASDHLRKAIGLLQDAGEWVEVAGCMSMLGRIELEQGNISEAIAQLTQVLNSQSRCRETATTICDLASAHLRSGDSKVARDLFERAVAVAESFGQFRIAVRAFSGASACYASSGQMNEAFEHCNRALRLCETIGDQELLSDVHATLGSLYRRMKRWREAESHTLTSIDILKALKSPQLLAQRYSDLAELYENAGNSRKARLWTNRAARMKEWVEQPSISQPPRISNSTSRLPAGEFVKKS